MDLHRHMVKLAAVLVTSMGLAVVFAYWHNEEQEFNKVRRSVFSDVSSHLSAAINRNLDSVESILEGVRGVQQSSPNLTREGLAAYYQSVQQSVSASGLQGVAMVRHVPQSGLPSHVEQMRKTAGADYHIRPLTEQTYYAPITMIEPMRGRNLRVPGFDVASNPVAKQALEQSMQSGQRALSQKLNLVQDSGDASPAVVMYVPIFRLALPLRTERERADALEGWVSGPLRMVDFLGAIKSEIPTDVAVAIYDGEPVSQANLLFSSSAVHQANASSASISQTLVDVGGRHWTLVTSTLPAFEERFRDQQGHWDIALTGTFVSLLLGLLTWSLTTTRSRALGIAHDMTLELHAVQADLDATLDALPDVLFELGLDGRYYKYRTLKTDQLAAPPEHFLGKLISDILPEDAARICLDALSEANQKGFSFGRQIAIPLADKVHWFELSVARKKTTPATERRFVMVSRDVTDRVLAAQQSELDAQVFNMALDGIVIADAHRRVASVNKAFTDITGFAEGDILGQLLDFEPANQQEPHFVEEIWRKVQDQGYWQGEIAGTRKGGESFPQWLSVSAVKDATGAVSKYICIMSDLTESKAAQERIDHLAQYDKLTELPNHEILYDRTRRALSKAERSGLPVAMLYIDIDKFQHINDSLGRAIGDHIIVAVAARLGANLQVEDTVSRQGGDEFFILCPDTDANGAAHVADRLLRKMKEPFVLDDGQELRLTASIGISLYPENGSNFDRLIQCAGTALKHSKQNGRSNFTFFAEDMHKRVREVLLIENQLRQALTRNEFVLHYQPQFDATTQAIVGAEALIRWNHPERGLVSPGLFIPIAESSGQIVEIGDWVLRTAIQQIADWQREGLQVVPVAVNLSALQFHRASLCDLVTTTLQEHRLPPALLELELTEGIAMENSAFTVDQINKLHGLGITLSIDDFGTGYSSLSYLTRYEIDKLKIDQSFVQQLKSSTDQSAIICAIISMARGLGFKTIAEGVETQVQLDYLREQGCDEIQGYLLGRPVTAEHFAQFLQK